MSIPHLFRCPISLDLFTDPVTLSTGQTYDRPSIEKWLADGNLTCPVTMQTLHDTTVVPNHTLRHLIDQWLLSAPSNPITEASGFSLTTLKQNLHFSGSSPATKLETLRKVRTLSVESDTGQACLIQLGFFPLLLQFLFQTQEFADPELVELALDCILSLSPSAHLGSLNMIGKDSNLDSVLLLLEQGNVRIKIRFCYLSEIIATSPMTQELCLILGRTQRVWQILVCLLYSRVDAQVPEAAVQAIAGLCSFEANRGDAIGEGVVDGLVYYLSNPVRRNASRALATLEVLLGMEMGRRVVIKNLSAAHVLVELVFRVSLGHEGSEHAVGSLLIACRESARVRREAVRAGVVTRLLLLLQSQCGGKAKSKARALLKLLRAGVGD